jgi:2-C-methyl-D-erythritol 4-phosphate cytidylyltransferase/2-C-methyl-D-erythritol 2,4-cyclodiphosphate synthase
MRAWALILAAGSGSRLADATRGLEKQFLAWRGAPLYWHCALAFGACARMAGLVFVLPHGRLEAEAERLRLLDAGARLGLPWRIASGGPRRQDSVRNGLAALPADAAWALVHDAARPFVSPALINRVLDELEQGAPAAIPGLDVADTIKLVHDGLVTATPDRSRVRAVQTPQGFRLPVLLEAHSRALDAGWAVTDDAAMLERCGIPVRVVRGEAANRKITHPEDLDMLTERAPLPLPPRIGFGYDVHRYVEATHPEARPLRLGGVMMPGSLMVQAHSDGDALLHALADALLACCAGGDIGRLFPQDDPACAGMNSAIIVDEALRRLHAAGMRPAHADVTIIAQTPRMAPHSREIQRNLMRLLALDEGSVSLKATTEEGLGFTGNREGLKAVVLLTAVCCASAKDMAE